MMDRISVRVCQRGTGVERTSFPPSSPVGLTTPWVLRLRGTVSWAAAASSRLLRVDARGRIDSVVDAAYDKRFEEVESMEYRVLSQQDRRWTGNGS